MSEVERCHDERARTEWEQLERPKTEDAVTMRTLDECLFRERMEEVLDTGNLTPDDWAEASFAHPWEIRPLLEQGGLATLDVVACDGGLEPLDEAPGPWDEEARRVLVEFCFSVGRDSVPGAAGHILYVGQKTRRAGAS
jgi:hypothetical protein